MIVADTSSWIAYIQGADGEDVRLLERALEEQQLLMAPAVLTALLSDPNLPSEIAETLLAVPLIELETGYWARAGALRAKAMARKRKARLGNVLIAQSCIDRNVPLLTRERDFLTFTKAAALDLVVGSAYPKRRKL